MQPQCPVTAVLPDGHLPGERPRDFALLRLRDGDRPHPGCSSVSTLSSFANTFLFLYFTRLMICPVSAVGDRAVRLQPSLPAQRADPGVREPDLLQAAHPQSHHAGSAHVLHRQHLLLHLLPAGQAQIIACLHTKLLLVHF